MTFQQYFAGLPTATQCVALLAGAACVWFVTLFLKSFFDGLFAVLMPRPKKEKVR
jgi:hypothetical protein